MGFHLVDILIVAAIGLALFGSKSLQSIARSAGKTAAQAKEAKDRLMADIPLDEISKVTNTLPHVPTNSRDVLNMLMKSNGESQQETPASE